MNYGEEVDKLREIRGRTTSTLVARAVRHAIGALESNRSQEAARGIKTGVREAKRRIIDAKRSATLHDEWKLAQELNSVWWALDKGEGEHDYSIDYKYGDDREV